MTFTNDQWQEAVVYSANNPAGGGTQYTDGASTPANPIGTMPVFDNAGTIAHVSAANPLPVAATVTPAANQRVNAHSGDFVDGAIATLGTEADAAITNPATNGTVIAYLRGILTQLADTLSDGDNLTTIATNTSGLATDAHASSIVTNTANIPAKGSAAMAASTPVTIATNDTVLSELLTDTDNLATINTNVATTVPGVQGWIAATGTGTASQDDSLTFASQVRKVVLYNAASVPVPFEFDTTSTATSIPIQPGQYMVFDDVLCTVVHVFPSALLPINTTSGLYVKGWK